MGFGADLPIRPGDDGTTVGDEATGVKKSDCIVTFPYANGHHSVDLAYRFVLLTKAEKLALHVL